MHVLLRQYNLVKQRRETLFRYCDTISQDHFTFDHKSFGDRSIQYLFVHIANTYIGWLGHFTEINSVVFVKPEEYKTLKNIRTLYQSIDILTVKFLNEVEPVFENPITNKISSRGVEVSLTPLQLFTHVITHEYHHKGQILSMSRQLGYTPIDTDIIRFE
jgi:uncharacterized damage-inducible protein DinB